jgi:type II secretory pathway pseudopilin PulG
MSARAPQSPCGRGRARGFTIVELLVALCAGVLVSMAAFMLSRDATAFFQREARISSAQLSLTLALNRITGDIQRAGFLSAPNITADPTICAQTNATWPPGLSLLAGVNIAPSTQATPQSLAQTPPMTPDQIILGGSMDSSEIYAVQSITLGAGGAPLITLQGPTTEPATIRAIATLGATETLVSKMTPVFYPSTYPTPAVSSGRFAHIYLPDGNTHWFGVIDSFALGTNGGIVVQLAPLPTLPVLPVNSCGIVMGASGSGWLFSVVSRVKYDIRSLAGGSSQYTPVVAPVSPQVTGDSGRTELVRTELAADNTELAGSAELVAEYAVDMRFGITVSTKVSTLNYSPTVTTYAFGDANVYTIAADVGHNGTPELIRAVQVRLATRTRAPDRDTGLPAGPDGRSLRFLIDPTLQMQPAYARMRTVYANVALPNQGGFSLW